MSKLADALEKAYQENGQALARPRRRLSDDKSKRLFFYFLHLNERNPNQFTAKWDQIADANFDAKNLTLILHSVTKHIKKKNINDKTRGKILSHIRSNINVWEQAALEKYETFNNQEIATSLWSLAIIDSFYKNDSLIETFNNLKTVLNPDALTLNDHRDIKQIRDADLWFKGKSTLKDPPRDDWNQKSTLEENVKKTFDRAGYRTEPLTNAVLIPDLDDAIDFPVYNNLDLSQNFWSEIDGNYHFINTQRAKNPSDLVYNIHTIFRSALERRLAPPDSIILRVDVITANKIYKTKTKEATRLCDKLLYAAIKAGPGIHKTTNDPSKVVRMVQHDRCLKMTA